jgi:SpoVK/Ycf46/Vps4 family AAA+-type ATPase
LEIHLGLKGPATKPPALRLSPQELEALLLDLVRETEGMSGAELEELVRRAKARAFASNRDAILPEDFYHVLGTFRINKEEGWDFRCATFPGGNPNRTSLWITNF